MEIQNSVGADLIVQIGEAVRIQLRGSVLNSVGVYTKLTRLVVDSDWDRKSFAFQWMDEDKNETLVTDANDDEIEVVEERREEIKGKER